MNIEFSKEHIMLRQQIRKFAENEIAPLAAEIDREHKYPQESVDKLFKFGYMAVGMDAKYGGTGLDRVAQTIVTEEIARKCAATAAVYSIHSAGVAPLQKFGTPEQKEMYLPKFISGGMIAAFALTEPNAGSDAANVQTVAVEDGDYYVINGAKCFITGAGKAGMYTVFASTEPKLKTRGLTAFLIDAGAEGLSIGKIEEKMGIRGSQTGELILEDVRVHKSQILGKLNGAFKIALTCIDGARISVAAAQALGIAEEAFALSVEYAKGRVQFGSPIGHNQGLQWYLVDMKTKLEAARLLTYTAARMYNEGKRVTSEAAMAKLYASEAAREITNLALQIHGGYGYMQDYPLERMYRDAKITEIYEGTSEICKLVIGRGIIG